MACTCSQVNETYSRAGRAILARCHQQITRVPNTGFAGWETVTVISFTYLHTQLHCYQQGVISMDCVDAAMRNVEQRHTDQLLALQTDSLHLYSLKWPQERHRHASWSMAHRRAQNSLVSSASRNRDQNPSHRRNNLRCFIKCFTNKMSYILRRWSYNCILVHSQVSWCLFVCLSICLFVCAVFLSRLWSDFDQTRTYVICLGLVVSPRI